MTLAWDLEYLRELINNKVIHPTEQKMYTDIINRIAKRFKDIENALR